MNYVTDAVRTESLSEEVFARLENRGTVRLLHAGMGLGTEAGEFLDSVKRHVYYGKEIDRVNLKEELGDVLWYIAIACHELGITIEEVMEANISKLRARYPQKFTEDNAINRDLDSERKVLEKA